MTRRCVIRAAGSHSWWSKGASGGNVFTICRDRYESEHVTEILSALLTIDVTGEGLCLTGHCSCLLLLRCMTSDWPVPE